MAEEIWNTFKLDGWREPVTVKYRGEITEEQIVKHPGFEKWLNTLRSSLKQQKFRDHPFHDFPYKLKEIEVQSYYLIETKAGKRPLFMNIVAKVENGKLDEKGNPESLPGVAFLRGGAVAVLIILRPSDSLDERYVVMTDQPRIPAGSLTFMEIPAGMIDPEDGSFAGAAARELKEEVGLELKAEDLIDMTELVLKGSRRDQEETLQDAMYPSPGGCDEFIRIFLWEKEMDRMQIDGMRGRLTGERSEREKITVRLLNYEKLLQVGARDGKTLAAWSLYEYLKRTRQVK